MNTPAQCGVIKPPKTDIYSEAPHRGEFDVVDAAPWALGGAADQFGLVEAVDGLGEGVDAPIGQVLVCGGCWRWRWSVMTRW